MSLTIKSLNNNDIIKTKKVRLEENTKGITIISLVVTIVVLLILARGKYYNDYRR